MDLIRAHQGKQLLQKLQAEGTYADHGLVFADPLGRPLNPMALARRVGIEHARLHDLRHFHASVMLQQGESLALVSKRPGHASMSTTGDIHAHILPGWQKEAAKAFAKAMERG